MNVRTSITDPLRIDAVNFSKTDAAIGMTLCPGKIGDSTFGDSWHRDLSLDIEAIKAWGCRILVTVMEDEELTSFHVSNIGNVAAAAGMEWLQLPVTDGAVPDERFERVWPTVVRSLLTTLRQGQRVVIHCRGGLGRTGTVVCLLLIEQGFSPKDVLGMVRAARPGAVETTEQEAFVLGYKARFSNNVAG